MPTANKPSPQGEKAFSAQDVEIAERRVATARVRAARAGLSAAHSLEESAAHHERIAKVQDSCVEQGVSHTDIHRRSASVHREAAAEDRRLAERKRRESEANLAAGAGY